jgi:CRISPR-associated protein Csd1
MIHLLAEYCRQQGVVAEPGFGPKLVRWAICCDADGQYTGLIELGEVAGKNNRGREFARCPDLSQGELIGGSGSRRHFLADTAEVVLLLSKTPDEPKLIKKHDFFGSLLRRASLSMPALTPIVKLLYAPSYSPTEVEKIRLECERQKVKPNDRVTFRVESAFPLDQDYWHDWWREFRQGLSEREILSTPRPRCFVTGELTEPARTHLKITGLMSVGGQPAGDVLVGFDKDAFCSYNFSQGLNSSISPVGMAGYRSGLNELLSRSSVRVGNARVAFWFKDRVEDGENPLWALLGPPLRADDLAARERVIDFLHSVQAGRSRPVPLEATGTTL